MGELKKRGNIWWIRYYRAGKRYEESSDSTKREHARTLLRLREGDAAKGVPITPKIGRVLFDEAVQDVVNDYVANGKRSVRLLKIRLARHLKPYLGGRRMASITTADVREYVTHRQSEAASNGTINRELAILKRAFTLAIQAGKLLTRPHVPMLREAAPRAGFFEIDQFEAVRRRLPEEVRPVVTFAYITGWRLPSEVLTLTWRQIDFVDETVRLDPGKTKSGEGRVFPFTVELRQILKAQREYVRAIERRLGRVIPLVWCWDDGSPIRDFRGSWKTACRAVGVPGRVPHDFRRSAIRNMVKRGVPERVAMQLAGHRTRSIFDRYAIVSEGDLVNAAARLEGVASGHASDTASATPTRSKGRDVSGTDE